MVSDPRYWLLIALAVAVHWALPARRRATFIAVLSFAGVCYFDLGAGVAMALIAGLVWVLYGAAAARVSTRVATRAAIVVTTAYLAWFKYLPAVAAALGSGYDLMRLMLPLGISYFAFKMIHYAIERGRGTLPDHGLDDLVAFIFLVPIFSAGPIQRFDLFVRQRSDTWSTDHAWVGLTRIAHGLVKKFVVAVVVMALIERVSFGNVSTLLERLDQVSPVRVMAFLVLSYLFVYMDFSGYTDIAIGTSRLFGLRIMENFNWPILAPNIGNLWKRWHMSLASWCQSYIYMPMLGYSRNPYIAVVSSFLVMGLWHAAAWNWIAWGLYNALGVAAYQTWTQQARRRRWTFVKSRPYRVAVAPLTFLFFSGSFAFTMTHPDNGLWAALRLLAKCVGVDLPA